ncbi:MAG TPA: hypothetical protein VGC06_03080 [Actinomycetes bacterium]
MALEDSGETQGAMAAYRRAVASGATAVGPQAAVRLGDLLSEEDPKGAQAAYQRAIALGYPEWTAWVAFNLGALLEELATRTRRSPPTGRPWNRVARRRRRRLP